MRVYGILLMLAALCSVSTGLNLEKHGADIIGVYEPLSVRGAVMTGVSKENNAPVKSDVVSFDQASYISVHFSKFNLPQGHYVIVRSEDNSVQHKYTGLGRAQQGLSSYGFFATYVRGDTAIVDYYANNVQEIDQGNYGYRIDMFGRGFPNALEQVGDESLCSADNSKESVCYKDQDDVAAEAYRQSKAVARLIIAGRGLCTGWLVGCDGHLMTNEHCINNQADASNTDFEFLAQGDSCDKDCKTTLGCTGTIAASSATLVAVDEPLDYSLLKLNTTSDVNGDFGFLTLREEAPVVGERIYIPQHPQGWGKRIAIEVDDGSFAKIDTLSIANGCGDKQVGYMADTQGGSSGSPVLAAKDHSVVALHHCGGCPNTGHQISRIVKSLVENDILPPCAIGDSPTPAPTTQMPTPAPPADCHWNWWKFRCSPRDACRWHWRKFSCGPK